MNENVDVRNIALVGLQNKTLVENILNNKNLKIVYILEDDEAKTQDLKRNLDLQYVIQGPLEEAELMLEDRKIEGVIVSLELKDRKKWILKSLKADKCVLVDGIFSSKLEDIERCYEISKKVDKSLSRIDLLKRYQPFVDVKKQLMTLEHLSVIKVIARSKPSLTCIQELLFNCVDLLCWILDVYPEKVGAVAASKKLDQVSDIVVTLKVPKETLIAVIDIGLHQSNTEKMTIKICGDGKSISGSMKCGGKLVKKVGPSVIQKYLYNDPSAFQNNCEEVLNHFHTTLIENSDSKEESENLLKCARVITAISDSLNQEAFINLNYESFFNLMNYK